MAFNSFKKTITNLFGSIFNAKPKKPSIKSMLQETIALNKLQARQIAALEKQLKEQERQIQQLSQEKQTILKEANRREKELKKITADIETEFNKTLEKLNKTAEEQSLYETAPPEVDDYYLSDEDLNSVEFNEYTNRDIEYYLEADKLQELDDWLLSDRNPFDMPEDFNNLSGSERSAYISEYLYYQADQNPMLFYDDNTHSYYDDIKDVPIWGAEFNNWFNNQRTIDTI